MRKGQKHTEAAKAAIRAAALRKAQEIKADPVREEEIREKQRVGKLVHYARYRAFMSLMG